MNELRKLLQGIFHSWVVARDDRNATKHYKYFIARCMTSPTAESIYAYEAIRLLLKGLASGKVTQFLTNVTI